MQLGTGRAGIQTQMCSLVKDFLCPACTGDHGEREEKTTGNVVTAPSLAISSNQNICYELLCLQPRFLGVSGNSAVV